jgi:NADH-quinone oxidoreductase subunit G
VTNAAGKTSTSNACVTKVAKGLKVETVAPKAVDTAKKNLQKLLDIHDERCTTCVANSRCEFRPVVFGLQLQNLKRAPPIPNSIDESTNAIRLDPSKCVLCKRCVRACKNFSGQNVLKVAKGKAGARQYVQPSSGSNLSQTKCVRCGQCTLYCPVGAITEKSEATAVLAALQNRKKKLYAVQVDPTVSITLSEALGQPITNGKVVSALKALGFNVVLDTSFAADIHAVSLARDLIKKLPTPDTIFTTTCSSFVNYVQKSNTALLGSLSTVKSPTAICSGFIATALSKSKGVNPSDVYAVSVGPCTAKKGGADVALTVRELVDLLRLGGIDLASLPEANYDLQAGSGSAALYGASGGVVEATLRAAYRILNGKDLPDASVQKLRGAGAQKVVTVNLGSQQVKVAAVSGLAEGQKFLDKLKKKDPAVAGVKLVEILACPGGCVVGGGTPKPANKAAIEARVKAVAQSSANAAQKYAAVDGGIDPQLLETLVRTSYGKK